MTYPCLWCRQPLTFIPGRGWQHPDGSVVVVRLDGRDDHVATPDRSKCDGPKDKQARHCINCWDWKPYPPDLIEAVRTLYQAAIAGSMAAAEQKAHERRSRDAAGRFARESG